MEIKFTFFPACSWIISVLPKNHKYFLNNLSLPVESRQVDIYINTVEVFFQLRGKDILYKLCDYFFLGLFMFTNKVPFTLSPAPACICFCCWILPQPRISIPLHGFYHNHTPLHHLIIAKCKYILLLPLLFYFLFYTLHEK